MSQVFGQKVGDKFTKLSKLGFSMEYFTADFLQFFTKNCQSLAFGLVAGYLPTNLSISGLFSILPNFLSILFSCVGIGPPQRRECRGAIFPVKRTIYRIKIIICNAVKYLHDNLTLKPHLHESHCFERLSFRVP